jgi:hypothetical protein
MRNGPSYFLSHNRHTLCMSYLYYTRAAGGCQEAADRNVRPTMPHCFPKGILHSFDEVDEVGQQLGYLIGCVVQDQMARAGDDL